MLETWRKIPESRECQIHLSLCILCACNWWLIFFLSQTEIVYRQSGSGVRMHWQRMSKCWISCQRKWCLASGRRGFPPSWKSKHLRRHKWDTDRITDFVSTPFIIWTHYSLSCLSSLILQMGLLRGEEGVKDLQTLRGNRTHTHLMISWTRKVHSLKEQLNGRIPHLFLTFFPSSPRLFLRIFLLPESIRHFSSLRLKEHRN